MLFNSFEYFLFLPAVFLLYWFVFARNVRSRNWFILFASYFFYAWWDWRFLLLIIASSTIDYLVGQQIFIADEKKIKKRWLSLSLIGNLGLLGVFKYYNFFVGSFISAFSFVGLDLNVSTLNVILPVGISFYTFQTLSYSLDIYRGKLEPVKDWLPFFCFVGFFPQLVAGPIERAKNLLPQFTKIRPFKNEMAKDGLRLILWGLAKKIIIADTFAMAVDDIFNKHAGYSGIELTLGLIYFGFQLYGDFSGYSDIAIGSGKLLGFSLMRNFRYPFFASDVEDFWRRWHISLTTWIRDYIFFAFEIKKRDNYMLYYLRNVFIVFFFIGLWHGARWTYVLWGISFFFLFLIEYGFRKFIRFDGNYKTVGLKLVGGIAKPARTAVFFSGLFLGLVLFRSPDLESSMSYFNRLFDPNAIWPVVKGHHLKFIPHLLLFIGWEWLFRKRYHGLELDRLSVPSRWTVYFVVIALIFYYFGVEQPFVYFQF